MTAILRREIHAHLHSQQFVVVLVLSAVLFAMSAWTSARTYRERMARYREGVAKVSREPDTRGTYLYSQPSPLAFVAAGSASSQQAAYSLTPKGGWKPLYQETQNFKMPSVLELDWVFLIGVVFSLYALLLSFHSISGEKEIGTLRLMLSHPIGRRRVLLAKHLAILLSVAPALLAGILINLTVTSVLTPEVLRPETMARIALVVVLALLLISAFVLLGLLVSCLVTPSSVVLLVVLSAWIALAIIVPNASGIVANLVTRAPREFQAASQVQPLIDEIRHANGDLRRRVERGEVTDKETIERMARDMFDRGIARVQNVYMTYDATTRRRIALARRIARASPIALFQYACESFANTGFVHDNRLLHDVKAYSEVFDQYVLEKTGVVIPFVSWGTHFEVELNGETITVQSYSDNYEGDMTDFPEFTETKRDLRQDLRDAIMDIGGLALLNLMLAGSAFAAFARCDVR